MGVDRSRRLKELEAENARLKKLAADLSLDKAIIKEGSGETSEPGEKKQAVHHVCEPSGGPQWQACEVIGQARLTQRHILKIPDDEERLVDRFAALASQRGARTARAHRCWDVDYRTWKPLGERICGVVHREAQE